MTTSVDDLFTELFAHVTVLEHHARVVLNELGDDSSVHQALRERIRQTHEHARAVSRLVGELSAAQVVAMPGDGRLRDI